METLEELEQQAAQAVAKGCEFLTEELGPDWRSRMTGPVDIRSVHSCVLAQLSGTGSYWDGAEMLGLHNGPGEEENFRRRAELGFTVVPLRTWDGHSPEAVARRGQLWTLLSEAWNTELGFTDSVL